jgi:hypothetical protein
MTNDQRINDAVKLLLEFANEQHREMTGVKNALSALVQQLEPPVKTKYESAMAEIAIQTLESLQSRDAVSQRLREALRAIEVPSRKAS